MKLTTRHYLVVRDGRNTPVTGADGEVALHSTLQGAWDVLLSGGVRPRNTQNAIRSIRVPEGVWKVCPEYIIQSETSFEDALREPVVKPVLPAPLRGKRKVKIRRED